MIRGALGFLIAAAACGAPDPAPPPASAAAGAGQPVAAGSESTRPAVVFLGTSLTAGYGLDSPALAYPAIIGRKLDSLSAGLRVVNAGVSGETSAGALRRADWVLEQGPVAVLVIETGANDGLRGQPPDSVKANIQAIIDRARELEPEPRIVLAGMEALPNLGETYAGRFRQIYRELAQENDLPLVPFLLEGVAGIDSLNQADGIHPTPRGQEVVADNVWRVLRDVVLPGPR